ncbi:hypothetical protein V6N13_008981 [Hibiscus sabdariffa]
MLAILIHHRERKIYPQPEQALHRKVWIGADNRRKKKHLMKMTLGMITTIMIWIIAVNVIDIWGKGVHVWWAQCSLTNNCKDCSVIPTGVEFQDKEFVKNSKEVDNRIGPSWAEIVSNKMCEGSFHSVENGLDSEDMDQMTNRLVEIDTKSPREVVGQDVEFNLFEERGFSDF